MKTAKLFIVALMFAATTAVAAEPDSIIVQFGGNSRMVIHTKDKAGMNKIKNYDLNKIFKDVAKELDSLNKDAYIIINEKNGDKYRNDTVFVFKTDKDTADKNNGDVSVSFKDGKIVIRDKDGRRRTVTLGNGGIKVGGRGRDGQPGEDGNANGDGKAGKDGKDYNSDDNEEDNGEELSINIPKKKSWKSPRKGFNMGVGVNTYGQNDALKYNTADYDLRVGSSRFFSMGWTRSALLGHGENTGAFLDFSVDFSWFNLMFDGNNTVAKDANGNVKYADLMVDGKPVSLAKSKLVAPYVNVSLMPTIVFKGSALEYISAGVYGGYRIGGYTKTKAIGGNKDHVKSNYNLNDFRYGIGAEIGLKSFPDLFVNYDMGELFQTNKGPVVRMLSFGIRL